MNTNIKKLDKDTFNYIKDEPNTIGRLGVKRNKIVEISNFITDQEAKSMISFFDSKSLDWADIAFHGSYGMGLSDNDFAMKSHGLSENFFEELRNKFKEAVELVFERKVKPNTSHAQKWEVGGFASPHSDNSDFAGTPNAFEINKYVGILYLNNNYDGGELYFPDHKISIKPQSLSYIIFPGGVENIHGVTEITKGTRYTMVSFWDYAEAEYSEERKSEWKEEFKIVREKQLNKDF